MAAYQNKFQAAWHSLAVGMFYRSQAEQNIRPPALWEMQTLATKLHWQRKAKAFLAEVVAETDVEGLANV